VAQTQLPPLWLDEAGRARAYVIDRSVSHGEKLRVERYYDKEGRLRFVLVNRFPGKTKIYLGADGAVVWAIAREPGGDAVEPQDRDDWETKPFAAWRADRSRWLPG